MNKYRVLLLNAANMESFPVYPYAFVQVAAVARRANIEVVCQDLLGIPVADWPETIERLQEQHEPAMFLITLRNTDSMTYGDYQLNSQGTDSGKAYFPIERTKTLINTIRALSKKPIVIGGFGFSILAKELMPILQPDFGVFGGADEFFLYFQDIIQGEYCHVANLLYFQGAKVMANKRFHFPPSAEIEYTPQAVEDMMAFYDRFPEPGFLGAPVEIMRGCNHTCVFCCEPFVAGRKVQYRDFEVIMGEIELLVKNGINEIYMISSELNPEGNEFILQLADRIKAFNDRQLAARKVSWFGANYLLKFDQDEYRRLSASRFTGGWFDITGLDDRNARAMHTPYRNENLVGHLKNYVQYERERVDHSANEASGAEKDRELPAAASAGNQQVHWTMFLGNPAATMQTIRKTIALTNREGLAKLFNSCYVVRPLRVFDYEKPSSEMLAVTFSIDHQLQRVSYQQTLPTFAYPPALLDQLGSEEAIETMFAHIADTYLSNAYKETRDWGEFLAGQVAGDWPGTLVQGVERPSADQAKMRVDNFLEEFFGTYAEELAAIKLPASLADLDQMTPYILAVTLYARGLSASEIVAKFAELAHIQQNDKKYQLVELFFNAILYRFNVQLVPEYKPLFMEGS